MPALEAKRAEIERKIRARELVFGLQDGLLSTVGVLSGVSAATQNPRIVILTGLAAGVTGGISMATGSYLAARTERGIFEKEFLDQKRLAEREPYLAQEALLEALCADGLDRPAAYRVVKTFSRHQDLLLRTVQEKVLGLGTADLSQPLKAGLVMFISFLVGALIPVLPFLFGLGRLALPVTWAVSVVTLLGVGVFKGVLTDSPRLRSGIEFAAVALGAAVIGWGIGQMFERLFGVSVAAG
jgi:VIT1/CCC1 family predicted Fe2+/Mn2+ transporter